MNKRRIRGFIALGLILSILIGFLIFTSPKTLPLGLLVVPFLLVFVILYKTLKLVMPNDKTQPRDRRWTIMAGVGATIPVLLLVFQSIHQLTIRDIVVSVSLAATAAFYITKANFIR